ncbi:hypothetical protein WJX73_000472 [Symbiochloris irregularis]|uniref:Uncharacterized protein n=1 Tax=Symbiochloris irregularis TaxID=706552 RepID=A0AAW1NNV2_9CHLO
MSSFLSHPPQLNPSLSWSYSPTAPNPPPYHIPPLYPLPYPSHFPTFPPFDPSPPVSSPTTFPILHVFLLPPSDLPPFPYRPSRPALHSPTLLRPPFPHALPLSRLLLFPTPSHFTPLLLHPFRSLTCFPPPRPVLLPMRLPQPPFNPDSPSYPSSLLHSPLLSIRTPSTPPVPSCPFLRLPAPSPQPPVPRPSPHSPRPLFHLSPASPLAPPTFSFPCPLLLPLT